MYRQTDQKVDDQYAASATSGNNGQIAAGNTVIQVGTINGGTVNLRPTEAAAVGDDVSLSLTGAERGELLAIRQLLNSLFGEEDLRDLAFDLAIEYEDLPGVARKDKARELVLFCRRRGRLAELKLAIVQRRPDAL